MYVVQHDKDGKPLPSTFGIVALKKVVYMDGCRLKLSCTLCKSGISYRSFATADFSKQTCPPFTPKQFIGCAHQQHVIAVLYAQLELQLDYAYDASGIEEAILESLVEDNLLSPGWYDLPYEMPLVGTFAVHLSQHWEPQVLKVKITHSYPRFIRTEHRKFATNVFVVPKIFQELANIVKYPRITEVRSMYLPLELDLALSVLLKT